MADHPGFELVADLDCELNGRHFQIRNGDHRELVIELPDLTTLLVLWRVNRRVDFGLATRLIDRITQRVVLQISGIAVASLNVTPNLLGRVIGLPRMRIQPIQFLRLLMTR